MADTFLPMLKSVIAKLKANTAIMGYVGSGANCRIYSDVPQPTIFPYLLVAVDSAPFDTKDTTGMEHTITVQAFSRHASPDEAGALAAAVYGLLHRNESGLTLDNGTLYNINFTGIGFVTKEPDGKTWQGLRQFRAVVMD